MKNILIPDRVSDNYEIEKNVFGEEFNIITQNAASKEEIPNEIWRSADAILAWHEINYDAELLSELKNCKVIVRVGVGFDNVDLIEAKKNKITICNVPDYGTNDVADHTLALLLTLARGIKAYNEEIINSNSWEWEIVGKLKRLQGLNLGIIGMGRIGNAVAKRARAFGFNIFFYDPYIPIGIEKVFNFTRFDKLYEMISNSDVISFHCPLTHETKRMANDDFFNNTKKGSILINTARGKIVESSSLFKALKDGVIKMAGLDVLEEEPLSPSDPLIKDWIKDKNWIKNRLLITPHSAFFNEQSYIEMRKKAAIEAKRVLSGQKPLNRII